MVFDLHFTQNAIALLSGLHPAVASPFVLELAGSLTVRKLSAGSLP